MAQEVCLVITTTGDEQSARAIAAAVLQQKLAACVQIFPVESHYVWRGAIQQDREFALHIKTRRALYAKLETAIRTIHTYDTPQVICLPIADGHPPYLNWIEEVTAP